MSMGSGREVQSIPPDVDGIPDWYKERGAAADKALDHTCMIQKYCRTKLYKVRRCRMKQDM